MSERPIYHLELAVGACSVGVRLNGFPLLALAPAVPMRVAPPLNHLLVSSGNRLELELGLPPTGAGESPDPLSLIPRMRVEGSLKRFEDGAIVGPETGDVQDRFGMGDVVSGGIPPALPLRYERVFDVAGPTFDWLLRDLPPSGTGRALEQTLKHYALRLRDLMRAGDVDALVEEFSLKLRDLAGAYYESEGTRRSSFAGFLNDLFLPTRPLLDFEEEHVRPVSHCEGRVWELRLDGQAPLLQTARGAEGERYSIPVFVAIVDGRARVVR